MGYIRVVIHGARSECPLACEFARYKGHFWEFYARWPLSGLEYYLPWPGYSQSLHYMLSISALWPSPRRKQYSKMHMQWLIHIAKNKTPKESTKFHYPSLFKFHPFIICSNGIKELYNSFHWWWQVIQLVNSPLVLLAPIISCRYYSLLTCLRE